MNLKRILAAFAALILLTGVADADVILDIVLSKSLEDEEHYGWLNGDIDYATDAPYFTILFEDQDVSEVYGNQVNIGVITCPLQDIAALEGSYDVMIELDTTNE